MAVDSGKGRPFRPCQPLQCLWQLVGPQADFGVLLPGLDMGMRGGPDTRRKPEQHASFAAQLMRHRFDGFEFVEIVGDDRADPGFDR